MTGILDGKNIYSAQINSNLKSKTATKQIKNLNKKLIILYCSI